MSGADEVEVLHDPDLPGGAPRLQPAQPELPVLDEHGNPAKHYVLPPDFPENAKPLGDGSYILKLDYPVTLKFADA